MEVLIVLEKIFSIYLPFNYFAATADFYSLIKVRSSQINFNWIDVLMLSNFLISISYFILSAIACYSLVTLYF